MAKWRPVDIRVWSDRKFLALTDDGRVLWLYLLTCPFMTTIPGVIVAGEMAIAECLGWSPKRLREGYRELLTKGLSARVDGRLIWLSKTFSYQKISGPKHIESMRKTWDDIPECALKSEIWNALKVACEDWSILFTKGFPIPHPIPLHEPLTKGQLPVTVSVSVSGSGEVTGEGCASRKPAQGVRHGVRLPEGWNPERSPANQAAESEARSRGVDLRLQLEKLRDWALAKGATGKDWDARWRNWLRDSRPSNGRPQQTNLDAQFERIRMLEAEEAANRSAGGG